MGSAMEGADGEDGGDTGADGDGVADAVDVSDAREPGRRHDDAARWFQGQRVR